MAQQVSWERIRSEEALEFLSVFYSSCGVIGRLR